MYRNVVYLLQARQVGLPSSVFSREVATSRYKSVECLTVTASARSNRAIFLAGEWLLKSGSPIIQDICQNSELLLDFPPDLCSSQGLPPRVSGVIHYEGPEFTQFLIMVVEDFHILMFRLSDGHCVHRFTSVVKLEDICFHNAHSFYARSIKRHMTAFVFDLVAGSFSLRWAINGSTLKGCRMLMVVEDVLWVFYQQGRSAKSVVCAVLNPFKFAPETRASASVLVINEDVLRTWTVLSFPASTLTADFVKCNTHLFFRPTEDTFSVFPFRPRHMGSSRSATFVIQQRDCVGNAQVGPFHASPSGREPVVSVLDSDSVFVSVIDSYALQIYEIVSDRVELLLRLSTGARGELILTVGSSACIGSGTATVVPPTITSSGRLVVPRVDVRSVASDVDELRAVTYWNFMVAVLYEKHIHIYTLRPLPQLLKRLALSKPALEVWDDFATHSLTWITAERIVLSQYGSSLTPKNFIMVLEAL